MRHAMQCAFAGDMTGAKYSQSMDLRRVSLGARWPDFLREKRGPFKSCSQWRRSSFSLWNQGASKAGGRRSRLVRGGA
jgi:hypothetical protein